MPKRVSSKSFIASNLKTLLGYLTIIGTALLISRILYSNTNNYAFLWWNLVLAAVPLASVYFMTKTNNMLFNFILLAIWLFFYPNAPYILTDYIHLGNAYSVNYIVLDFFIISLFALNGLLLGFASLQYILERATKQYSKVIYYPMLTIVSILTGSGLYMGRYLRFNSWEVVTNLPGMYKTILSSFFNSSQLQEFLVIVATFSAAHGFTYILYSKLFNKSLKRVRR